MNKVSFGKLETKEIGKQIILNFKHPVKELVWILQDEQNIATSGFYQNNWFNYGFNDGGLVISTDAVLGTNGTKWDGKNHDFLSTSQESGIVINTHERFQGEEEIILGIHKLNSITHVYLKNLSMFIVFL